MKKIKVLSLYDGKSCGAISLLDLGIEFEYYAIEIDQTARLLSESNINGIKRVENDVSKVTRDLIKALGPFDIFLAGPPCQTFSVAGKQQGDFKLLKKTVQILRWCKEFNPEIKYLIENVKMKDKLLKRFERIVGHKGRLINSALISYQSRERYYFTNLKEALPCPIEDKSLDCAKFISHGPLSDVKRFKLSDLFKNAKVKMINMEIGDVFNYSSSGRGKNGVEGRISLANKALTLTATGYSSRATTAVYMGNEMYRDLTTREMARLQGIPDAYDYSMISERQAEKIIGNGWQIDVIKFILRELLK